MIFLKVLLTGDSLCFHTYESAGLLRFTYLSRDDMPEQRTQSSITLAHVLLTQLCAQHIHNFFTLSRPQLIKCMKVRETYEVTILLRIEQVHEHGRERVKGVWCPLTTQNKIQAVVILST